MLQASAWKCPAPHAIIDFVQQMYTLRSTGSPTGSSTKCRLIWLFSRCSLHCISRPSVGYKGVVQSRAMIVKSGTVSHPAHRMWSVGTSWDSHCWWSQVCRYNLYDYMLLDTIRAAMWVVPLCTSGFKFPVSSLVWSVLIVVFAVCLLQLWFGCLLGMGSQKIKWIEYYLCFCECLSYSILL